jgi:8-oxo-dGTP pyrophosphatase MutT (NUDIX family)
MIIAASAAKSAFTWSGFLANAASFTATVIFIGAVISLAGTGLRRSQRFRRWSLVAPLRVATRTSLRARRRQNGRDEKQAREGNIRVLQEEFGSVREFRKTVKSLIAQHDNDPVAGFLLADLIAGAPMRGEHEWPRLAPVLLRIFTLAAKQRSSRMIARLLYPEDVKAYSALFGGIAEAVRQLAMSAPVAFDMYRPAVGAQVRAGRDAGFASFVTAFTGAVVLADAADSRSRCAEQVLIWHSRRFHDGESPDGTRQDTEPQNLRYDDRHVDGVGCSKWPDKDRRLGDFDQRVLHLRSVALAEATAEDGLSIVLETSETCYGITEAGESGAGCKNVPAYMGDTLPGDPLYFRSEREPVPGSGQGYDYRIARQDPDAGRVTLLTSQLGLVTADDQLVLQDRTSGVRHDASVIGASAGGVISLGGVTPSGDLDEAGWPDPAAAIAREALEETGVEVSPASCRPLCVYLLNARDRAKSRSAPQTGQLGAAILYMARTSLTSHEVAEAAKTGSDLARGTYERSGLTMCPAGDAQQMAHWAKEKAELLSMHAVIACTYASLVLFGREETEDALSEAFAEAPWWAIGAHEPSPAPRLIRDPRALMRGSCIDAVGPPTSKWPSAWDGLTPEGD